MFRPDGKFWVEARNVDNDTALCEKVAEDEPKEQTNQRMDIYVQKGPRKENNRAKKNRLMQQKPCVHLVFFLILPPHLILYMMLLHREFYVI